MLSDMPTSDSPRSGRQAQATRNDEAILAAARRVFMREPDAPIAAVAKEAGVGISALYRRYPGKEALLQTLCRDGLRRFIQIAQEAAADTGPWESFANFVRGIVDADVHSLTVHLAGTFTPTEELSTLAAEASKLAGGLLRTAKSAGVVRSDLHANDLAMLFEQLSAIHVADAHRTQALRRRYLQLQLDALRPSAITTRLPGPPPTAEELGDRWRPRGAA
jgi:AcrR family transcriptional regulator